MRKFDKYWLANCRRNRKNGAKICQVCPFIDEIVKYELPSARKYSVDSKKKQFIKQEIDRAKKGRLVDASEDYSKYIEIKEGE